MVPERVGHLSIQEPSSFVSGQTKEEDGLGILDDSDPHPTPGIHIPMEPYEHLNSKFFKHKSVYEEIQLSTIMSFLSLEIFPRF